MDPPRLVAGTWPPGTPTSAQPHREAFGGVFALQAVAAAEDISGATIIFRNDAEAALAAHRKGSFQSAEMQEAALLMNQLCADQDVDPLWLHSPGLQLIKEGVDGESRVAPAEALGPAVSDQLWARVLTLAQAVGWPITVDAFAVAANTRAPRFYSRFAEPQAEATDAFSVPDWRSSPCPLCGLHHQETLFAFPPVPMMKHFVRKAVADGTRAIVVTTLAPTAPYWTKLIGAAVGNQPEGFIRIRNPAAFLVAAGSFHPHELVILACDFSTLPRPPNAPLASAAPAGTCPGAIAPRPRGAIGSADDQLESQALRLALARLCHVPGGCSASSLGV